jgi:6-pyruvoyltetrahydropterin/6-carboxytetrahydropterin synthase
MDGDRVHITKRAEIATSHRCLNPNWGAEQNTAVYGQETRPHGHNYLVEATVSGQVNPRTGMVVNIKQVKSVLKEVLSHFDHQDLNGDHPAFANTAPTSERVAMLMFDTLASRIDDGRLERLRLFETDDVFFEIYHPDSRLNQPAPRGAMLITRRYTFSAAHRLHAPSLSEAENAALFLDCNNPNGHGHNYQLEVTVNGQLDSDTGLATDHHALDDAINKAVVSRYHYRHLNDDLPEFADLVTTSENIIRVIWQRLTEALGEGTLHKVRLGETRDNYFEYYG